MLSTLVIEDDLVGRLSRPGRTCVSILVTPPSKVLLTDAYKSRGDFISGKLLARHAPLLLARERLLCTTSFMQLG